MAKWHLSTTSSLTHNAPITRLNHSVIERIRDQENTKTARSIFRTIVCVETTFFCHFSETGRTTANFSVTLAAVITGNRQTLQRQRFCLEAKNKVVVFFFFISNSYLIHQDTQSDYSKYRGCTWNANIYRLLDVVHRGFYPL